jgi:hypothetical protein
MGLALRLAAAAFQRAVGNHQWLQDNGGAAPRLAQAQAKVNERLSDLRQIINANSGRLK